VRFSAKIDNFTCLSADLFCKYRTYYTQIKAHKTLFNFAPKKPLRYSFKIHKNILKSKKIPRKKQITVAYLLISRRYILEITTKSKSAKRSLIPQQKNHYATVSKSQKSSKRSPNSLKIPRKKQIPLSKFHVYQKKQHNCYQFKACKTLFNLTLKNHYTTISEFPKKSSQTHPQLSSQ
jgi:hypothetical protein